MDTLCQAHDNNTKNVHLKGEIQPPNIRVRYFKQRWKKETRLPAGMESLGAVFVALGWILRRPKRTRLNLSEKLGKQDGGSLSTGVLASGGWFSTFVLQNSRRTFHRLLRRRPGN